MMDEYKDIIAYITQKYNPHTVIFYGSRADGSGTSDSDFDAVVISDSAADCRDVGKVSGVELDLFVYNTKKVGGCLGDFDRLTRIAGGRAVIDEKGIGAELLRCVESYIEKSSVHCDEEKKRIAEWCSRMLRRVESGGELGEYRRCCLVADSLEVYFIMRDRFFAGPDKSLRWLKENEPSHYRAYADALRNPDSEYLRGWLRVATKRA